MGELLNLPNIGVEVERQLNQVGILSFEDLKKYGSKQTWLKIKAIDASACIHRLYALEGALQNTRKKDLSAECKEDLKDFYNQFKGKIKSKTR